MKKPLLAFVALCLVATLGHGQSKEDALNAKSITWFGLDFSKAAFIGDGFVTPDQVKNELLIPINQLMLDEQVKFNIPKFFEVPNVVNDFDDVTRHTKEIDNKEMKIFHTSEDYSITETDVQKIISDYKSDKDGYGLVFVVESFNKTAVQGAIWVTYFDIKSKKVVFTTKLTSKPMGFGLRNFWAGSVYGIMKLAQHDKSSW